LMSVSARLLSSLLYLFLAGHLRSLR
jgi:hypothetical protein